MSLLCGVCHDDITDEFGILSRLERDEDGLRIPDQEADYVPANVAVCESCWATIPEAERLPATMKPELDRSTETIYGYQSATSTPRVPGGSMTWSGIVSFDATTVFLRETSIVGRYPKAIPIIDEMARDLAERDT